MRLHHVQVACPPGGEEIARAFYAGGLGLTEVAKPPVLAARGGCWFRAYDGDGRVTAEIHVGVEEPFTPARKAHPSFVVTDLDEVAARLAAAGIDVAFNDEIPGVRRFETSDPFGNRLEFRGAVDPGSPFEPGA